MAAPSSVSPILVSSSSLSTPPHPTPSGVSFISSTPTASLRSTATTKRVSIVSLQTELNLDIEDDHVAQRGIDRRIERWLEQQCGGFAPESAGDEQPETRPTEEIRPQLRPVQSSITLSTTANCAMTPVTSASFSWESDPRLSTSASSTTPSSALAAPYFADSIHPISKSHFQSPPTRGNPEIEAARPDSPLLGFPVPTVDELPAPTLLGTINEGREITPLHGADVDKPLPLPPLPSTSFHITTTSAIAGIASQCVAPTPEPRRVRRTPKHSPTSSHSSSSSRLNHHSLSQSNGYPSVSQLPIGVGRPLVHPHPHSRTPSGSSSGNNVQDGIPIAPLPPFLMGRRDIHLETETAARSTLPSSSCMRTRSHSNAVPVSTKQFHLPTGMIHKSRSHVQLRNMIPASDHQTLNGPSQQPMASSSLCASGRAALMPRLVRKSSKTVASGPISRTHSNAQSSASVAAQETREEAEDPSRSRQISQSHIRQTSEILDRLESRVPSLSSSFCRNAVYIDSEDIGAKLDELLLLAKEEVERRVVEEEDDEGDTSEAGVEEREQWVDMVKGGEGSINQQIASPPNTPATGYFSSVLSVACLQAANTTDTCRGGLSEGAFYASPEAGSSRVYLGSSPISQNHSIEQLSSRNLIIAQDVEEHLPIRPSQLGTVNPDATIGSVVDLVSQEESVEALITGNIRDSSPMNIPTSLDGLEEEEMMEEALAFARDLAVDDRMIWGVRGSLEVFDDCWSESEDEEMGVGVYTDGGLPRMSVGPFETHSSAGGNPDATSDHARLMPASDGHDGSLAPPSMSKWSLTSSINEENRTSLDDKPKKDKKRRSFVPFISGDKDKDKELKEDGSVHKENGTIGKKRSRLASFISRLSSVGLGGSGFNTPSTHTPPMPTLSASNSSHALSTLFSAPPVPSKWNSPSLPALTPNISATPSRSSSPTALPDPPLLQQQPQVNIVADDDRLSSSPSSSRLVIESTACDSAPPTNRPFTPPPSIPLETSRRPIPPGIVIPPLPSRPPPELPTIAFPLGKAASEGMIPRDSSGTQSMSRPRSNSAADTFGKHVTFSNSLPNSSPRNEQASTLTLSSPLRRSVLAKSASASVLGLHQQVKPFSHFSPVDSAAGFCSDDGLVPPTPTSIVSTEDYGENRIREDIYDEGYGLQPNRPRLRAMSSLGALPLTGSSRSKGGGLKGFVGRLTGRGKNSAKASPAQVHIFLDDDYRTSPETTTPIAANSRKTPTPKHSPSGSFSNGPGAIINPTSAGSGGGGMLSGLKSYLDRTPFRQ